jgi:hypothetical protein
LFHSDLRQQGKKTLYRTRKLLVAGTGAAGSGAAGFILADARKIMELLTKKLKIKENQLQCGTSNQTKQREEQNKAIRNEAKPSKIKQAERSASLH